MLHKRVNRGIPMAGVGCRSPLIDDPRRPLNKNDSQQHGYAPAGAKHADKIRECRVNPYCIALILIESDLTPCMQTHSNSHACAIQASEWSIWMKSIICTHTVLF